LGTERGGSGRKLEEVWSDPKARAKDSEDTVMKDGSNNSDSYRELYEDLSGYEDEDEVLVAAPPATKNRLLHVRQQDRLGSDPDQPKHPLGAHPLTATDRWSRRW